MFATLDLAKTFDWLSQGPEERDLAHAGEVTALLTALWTEVEERIGPERFESELGTLYAGKLTSRSDHAWVQTNGEGESHLVNLTLEIEPKELSLNVVGWFDPQLESLERWLRTGAARRQLRQSAGWDALIFVRTGNRGKGGRVVFKGAEGRLLERMQLSETSPVDITLRLSGLRRKLGDDEKLSLHLRRAWSPSALADTDDFVEAIAAEVEAWLGPLAEIRLAQA
jgi:hypothetical protein